MMRILVTGSRDWADPWAFESTINDYMRGQFFFDEEYQQVWGYHTIVHGDCKTGLDFIAKGWAINNILPDEAHPANWRRYGGGAGPIRNEEMARLGADVCLAFPLGTGKSGTRDCMTAAERYDIPVIEYQGPYNPDPRMVEWNATHSPY
jgi:hypothetical protein